MAKIRLSAVLPKDDTGMNGLDEAFDRVIRHPKDRVLVVAWAKRATLTIDDKRGGAQQPTVEFEQIEVIGQNGDYDLGVNLLDRAYRRRNGDNPDQLDIQL